MRGYLMLIAWTSLSLMTVGGLLRQELYARYYYPNSSKPSTLPTREELLAYSSFGMFWLAGIALYVTLIWLWRMTRDEMNVDSRFAVIATLAWGLVTTWIIVGIESLLFSESAGNRNAQLWTWSVGSAMELVFLPSFGVILWCSGLAAMFVTIQSVWRWLPTQ